MKKQLEHLGRRILVVDDDIELCDLVSRYLTREGFRVELAHNGREGVEHALFQDPSLLLLDVMLPDMEGFEVLRLVRAKSRMPILMLTAKGDQQDRILGLEMGADDYLPKPFDPRELSARIEAILRRSSPNPTEVSGAGERIVVDDVELDEGARVVWRAGQRVELTTAEFDLLGAFLRSAGRVLLREEMVPAVLGREFLPFDRSIDNHVSNLRRKLGLKSDGLDRIKGVRGAGYVYVVSRERRESGK